MKSMRRFVTAALLAGLVPASALAQQQPAPSGTSSTPAPAATPAPAPTPAARPRTTPWAASQLSITTSANGAFFDRSYVLSGENVSAWDLNVSFRPRYRLSRAFQVRGRWDFNLEFTNSDSTTTNREPRFSDPVLDMWFLGVPPIGDLRIALAAGLIFPVSSESRANTLIVTPRVVAQLAWGKELFGGDFALIGQALYTHPFTQYTTPGVRGARPYAFSCVGNTADCSGQLRGGPNVHDQLSWTVILAQTWGDWSPGVAFGMIHQWAYTLSSDSQSSTQVGSTGSHLRQLTSFSGWLDYNPNPWLTIEAGYYQFRNILDGDGTYGNPFYAQYQDWRVYLNANIVLDKFYEAITGSGAGGGGVIRTHNSPRRTPLAATF